MVIRVGAKQNWAAEDEMVRWHHQLNGHQLGQTPGKGPDAGKDGRQEEKGAIEEEMAGWHQQLDGNEFEQTPGAGEGQGSLVCCSPWACKESVMTQ